MTKKEKDEEERILKEKQEYRKVRIISLLITSFIIVCLIGVSYFLVSRVGL
jgi:CHASE3 domain sensor protein